jgi:hypothetical protein
MSEFWKRQIRWELFDQRTLTNVEIGISLNDLAFFKLSKQAKEYEKPISKVLPLSLFDDWKEENAGLHNSIIYRRRKLKSLLNIHC